MPLAPPGLAPTPIPAIVNPGAGGPLAYRLLRDHVRVVTGPAEPGMANA